MRKAALVRPGPEGTSSADTWFRAAGAALLVVTMWIPWTASRVGGSQSTQRLVDLPMARVFFVACVVLIIAATALQLAGRTSAPAQATTLFAAVILTVVPLLGMALIELTTMWLSPDRLPTTFRRVAVGAKPMPGLWLTLCAGALCLIGANGLGDTVVRWFASLWTGLRERSGVAYAAALLLIAVPASGVARYGSWLDVRSSFDDWSVPGWALPWFGLLTLVVLIAAAGVGCAGAVRPSVGAGISMSILGWILTLVSGITIIVTSALPTVQAPAWVRSQLVELSSRAEDLAAASPVDIDTATIPTDLRIDVSSGRGALITFGAGGIIMLAGWLMCRFASTMDAE